jgi:2-keto-4-pentenoate hydratase/2-oxohepta-3-ene-1,7-dioic acid hydratase in catechol pathway
VRLVSFKPAAGSEQDWVPGLMADDGTVVDLVEGGCASARDSVRDLIAGLGGSRQQLERLAEAGGGVPFSEVHLGPPVPDPDKVICIGLNYLEHAGEVDMELPAAPILFPKFRNSLIGTGAPVPVPAITSQIDYEGELALVIGETCRDVREDAALSVIAGYMPFNDVSARDLQMKTSQWTAGKALDGFAPCGPALVTADEIDDVHDLELVTRLNGDEVQRASTSLMIFPVERLVAFITSLMTLEPGDIIATGTPSGVGFTRDPQLFMRDGDRVEVEISGLGTLSNPVGAAR